MFLIKFFNRVVFSILLFTFTFNSSFGYTVEPSDSSKKKESDFGIILNGESRTLFMSTINEGSYKDDYTLGTAVALKIKTKSFHGFEIGAGGSIRFNLFSSDITDPDPVSGGFNRYELGNYDVSNPGNYKDLYQLEELFIAYKNKSVSITAGRFLINTPFINPQDGRLRPTFEEGLWLNLFKNKKIKFTGGYISRILPRSTVKWYNPGKSFGVYPVGLNEEGSRSGYAGNIKSDGVIIGNLNTDLKNKFTVNVWNGYILNVINTAIIEINHNGRIENKSHEFYQGLIFAHQDAINDGGNADQALTYIQKGSQSNIISLQAGVKSNKINTSINYTHITGDGRYLMPREWGKEIFYTFLTRERNEGAGNVHAFMIKSTLTSSKNKLTNTVAYGYYNMPDVKNYRLNKYAIPTYHQINYEMSYKFDKKLNGIELKSIFAYKIGAGETYNNPKTVYNKIDMINMNFLLIYKI